MGGSFKSWKSLEAALRKENQDAMRETIDKSFQDAHENVDNFYNSSEGRYKRTGQLAESPEQEYSAYGNIAEGEIRLDTSYHYIPSGRNTKTIYGYAEDGGLRGNGGFWADTEADIQKNLNESYGKRFGK